MTSNRWLAFKFATTHDAVDLIADFLTQLSMAGVQIDDPCEFADLLTDPASFSDVDAKFINQLGDTVRITAYFAEYAEGVRCRPAGLTDAGDAQADAARAEAAPGIIFLPLPELENLLRRRLQEYSLYLPVGQGYLGCEEIHEEDWANSWKQYYKTLHLTDRLVINPSWIDYRPAEGEIVIQLDPGGAFGTGTHETTALCAEWLDQVIKPGMRVLDLGTGSGILAIIAARLGATVEAIDIDPMAVEIARANCLINSAAVDCHAGELADARILSFDVIVANIVAGVICALARFIPARLAPGGLFIASGIIGEKMGLVLAAAREAGLEPGSIREKGDWRAAVFYLSSQAAGPCRVEI